MAKQGLQGTPIHGSSPATSSRWEVVFTFYQYVADRVLRGPLRENELAQRALALSLGISIAMALSAVGSVLTRGPNPQAAVLVVGGVLSFGGIPILWGTRRPWVAVISTILGCYLPVTWVIWTGFGPAGPAATALPLLVVFGSVTGGRVGALFTLLLCILQSSALWLAVRRGWAFQSLENVESLFLITTFLVSVLILVVLDVYEQAQKNAKGALRVAMDELREAREAAELARDAAVRASNAKTVFLANMSHELRTPLNAIIGYAELLDEDLHPTQVESRADVGRIHRAGHHLLEFVNDVLDMSRIEADRLELCPEDFELADLLQEVRDRLANAASRRANSLQLTLPDTPVVVRQDRLRVDQVLTNLVSNAIKFTESGRVDMEVAIDGDQVEIRVTDTGRGMDEELAARCFEPFEQARGAAGGRDQGGTGLGLAISAQLARAMGGRLTVASHPGVGSCFTLTLPWTQSETAPAEHAMPFSNRA